MNNQDNIYLADDLNLQQIMKISNIIDIKYIDNSIKKVVNML